jgi:hypothetical protein
MASKRKLNGATSVDHVEGARKRANLDMRAFFYLAQHVPAEPPERYDPNAEARMFIKLKNDGAPAHPDYQIPECVLALAHKLHSGQCPRKLCDELRTRMHQRATRLAQAATQSAPAMA